MTNELPGVRQYGEECGIFGVATKTGADRSAAHSVYTALYALQHRGQQSAGIASVEQGQFHLHKGPGLVPDVFSEKKLSALTGPAAIGHVRYSMSGDSSTVNAQPIVVTHASGSMALCYNGRLVNAADLRRETEHRGGIFQTTNSAEVISYLLVRERMRTNTIEDAVLNAMEYLIGAYSVIVLTQGKLVAFRDPNGFRPLCIGQAEDGSILVSSESCAFPVLGGTLLREIEPGEVVVADLGTGTFRAIQSGIKAKSSLCTFEFTYFSRSDSVLDGASVDEVRLEAGRCLARRNTAEADCVVGVPDSGITPAIGFSRESGIPIRTGFVKNRYIGRTFIQPVAEREKALKIKLNALASSLAGQRVIVVDDSIIRGNTCRRTVELVREAGAKEIHYKVASPRFLYPCFFGTDIPSSEDLIAYRRTVDEIRALIGADSLDYLSVEELGDITKGIHRGVCDACFTGRYTVPVPIQNSGEINR